MRVSVEIAGNAIAGVSVQNGQIIRRSFARYGGGAAALLHVLERLTEEDTESVSLLADASLLESGEEAMELRIATECRFKIPCKICTKSQAVLRFAAENYGRCVCAAISFDQQIGMAVMDRSGQIEPFDARLSHAVLIPEGRKCGCGKRGCAVQYLGENNLVKYFHAAEKDVNDLDDVERFLQNNLKLVRAVRRRSGEIRAFTESVAAIRGVNRIYLCGKVTRFPWMRERVRASAGSCEILFSDRDQALIGATL